MKRNLNVKKLLAFFEANADILHKSRYHHEGFATHCLLVIGNMLTQYEAGKVSEEAMVAACLHDIAKPRTAALNKRNEACFYGHENVTYEEVAEFLDPGYPGFDKVLGLIRGHMLPLLVGENTPEPYRSANQEKLGRLVTEFGKQFEKDLMILADCDSRSSVKDDADLPEAEKEAALAKEKLLAIAA